MESNRVLYTDGKTTYAIAEKKLQWTPEKIN